jgi:hypothetical protein
MTFVGEMKCRIGSMIRADLRAVAAVPGSHRAVSSHEKVESRPKFSSRALP